jgi:hypothetical protein
MRNRLAQLATLICLATCHVSCTGDVQRAAKKYDFYFFPWGEWTGPYDVVFDSKRRSKPFDKAELRRVLPTLERMDLWDLSFIDSPLTDDAVDDLRRLRPRYLSILGTGISSAGIQELITIPGLAGICVPADVISSTRATYLMKWHPSVDVTRASYGETTHQWDIGNQVK